jgi:leucyl aminopeptidase
MEIRRTDKSGTQIEADWLVIPVFENANLAGSLLELDQALSGVIARLKDLGDLTGKLASTVQLRGISGVGARRALFVGLGTPDELTAARLDKAFMTAARAISDKSQTRVAVVIPTEVPGALSATDFVASAVACGIVGSQGQDLFRSERSRFPFASLELSVSGNPGDLDAAIERGTVLGQAINLTRDLINRPPQEITPLGFAQRAEAVAGDYGLRFEMFERSRLEQERMRSMLAVAQGSPQPPCMVVVEHQGGDANAPKLALVGKGVTFDSGGLSLKPTDGMLTMKCDMAGAATVLGAMSAIARLKLPINVIGYMGLVENMPGGSAFKLGDILTARNGVTIEVLNTDAEGRLVLADVLSYAVDAGAEKIVDLATLTGACVVALGEDVSGAFTNNQSWCDAVISAAKVAGEDVWQLPMWDLYEDLIKGDVGDIKNTGGRWGGAITAARFLKHFVGDRPWVHLDIAGPAFASSNKPHREAGATGHMVRTLVELARRFGA